MKAEPIRLIPQKLAVNIEFVVACCENKTFFQFVYVNFFQEIGVDCIY